MLDGRGHDSLSPPAARGRAAQHRPVIRLGAAGGKDNLPRLGAQGNGYRPVSYTHLFCRIPIENLFLLCYH